MHTAVSSPRNTAFYSPLDCFKPAFTFTHMQRNSCQQWENELKEGVKDDLCFQTPEPGVGGTAVVQWIYSDLVMKGFYYV